MNVSSRLQQFWESVFREPVWWWGTVIVFLEGVVSGAGTAEAVVWGEFVALTPPA